MRRQKSKKHIARWELIAFDIVRSSQVVRGRVLHILIIEDDLLVAMDIQSCVEDMGTVSTDVASSEYDAVRLALIRRPELIISDVRVAQGSGPAAVRRISEHQGLIPVLYVTGSPEAVTRTDPGARVIVKPYQRHQLMQQVKALEPTGFDTR